MNITEKDIGRSMKTNMGIGTLLVIQNDTNGITNWYGAEMEHDFTIGHHLKGLLESDSERGYFFKIEDIIEFVSPAKSVLPSDIGKVVKISYSGYSGKYVGKFATIVGLDYNHESQYIAVDFGSGSGENTCKNLLPEPTGLWVAEKDILFEAPLPEPVPTHTLDKPFDLLDLLNVGIDFAEFEVLHADIVEKDEEFGIIFTNWDYCMTFKFFQLQIIIDMLEDLGWISPIEIPIKQGMLLENKNGGIYVVAQIGSNEHLFLNISTFNRLNEKVFTRGAVLSDFPEFKIYNGELKLDKA